MPLRVQLLSDIHFEFLLGSSKLFLRELEPEGVDVLVLAGDVGNAFTVGDDLSMLCARYEKATVLYVPGNHEYYGGSPESVAATLGEVEASTPNLRVLEEQVVEIDGVVFAGTSLWFGRNDTGPDYSHMLNDFYQISRFTPWVYEANERATRFLEGLFAKPGQADVVITHHLPSEACVAPKYKGSPLNQFFVHPIADTLPHLPRYWFYGHTHTAMDFEQRGCRFVTNPYGYPNESKRGFRMNLVFDIDSCPDFTA